MTCIPPSIQIRRCGVCGMSGSDINIHGVCLRCGMAAERSSKLPTGEDGTGHKDARPSVDPAEGMRRGAQPEERSASPASSHFTFEPRPVVMRFAEAMERELRENDHKGGWDDESWRQLLPRLKEESNELRDMLRGGPSKWLTYANFAECILSEAADIANFAMMIADVVGALKVANPAHSSRLDSDPSAASSMASPRQEMHGAEGPSGDIRKPLTRDDLIEMRALLAKRWWEISANDKIEMWMLAERALPVLARALGEVAVDPSGDTSR